MLPLMRQLPDVAAAGGFAGIVVADLIRSDIPHALRFSANVKFLCLARLCAGVVAKLRAVPQEGTRNGPARGVLAHAHVQAKERRPERSTASTSFHTTIVGWSAGGGLPSQSLCHRINVFCRGAPHLGKATPPI